MRIPTIRLQLLDEDLQQPLVSGLVLQDARNSDARSASRDWLTAFHTLDSIGFRPAQDLP